MKTTWQKHRCMCISFNNLDFAGALTTIHEWDVILSLCVWPGNHVCFSLAEGICSAISLWSPPTFVAFQNVQQLLSIARESHLLIGQAKPGHLTEFPEVSQRHDLSLKNLSRVPRLPQKGNLGEWQQNQILWFQDMVPGTMSTEKWNGVTFSRRTTSTDNAVPWPSAAFMSMWRHAACL